ncbi:MAG: nucleotidyltransferase domain-containing protein [Gaiellaceae bacterium]
MTASSFEPDLSRWDAWSPAEAAQHLAGVETPWYVTAGWALDLFRGRQTRDHEDLEVAVPAHGFGAVQHALSEFELWAIGDGLAHPLTPETLATSHQTWVRESLTGTWRLDVMREPWDGDVWVFLRDHRIRLPHSRVIAHTVDGIPFAQPEIALLFKAKAVREKDEDDFVSVLPLLDPAQRRWLTEALTLVHPGHRWLTAMTA